MLYKTFIFLVIVTLFYKLPLISLGNGKFIKQNKEEKKDIRKVWVAFKLKKNERSIFNYTDMFFEHQTLDFSNPGDRDTLIIKNIITENPVALNFYKAFFTKEGQPKWIRYSLLATPGDTLHMSLTNEHGLDLSECKIENIFCDSSSSYYNTDSFPLSTQTNVAKNAAWKIFYQEINKSFELETNRINELMFHSQIDSIHYQIFTINCKLHYYEKISEWIFEKNDKYFKPALVVFKENVPKIQRVLNDKNIFLSDELIAVIDKLVMVERIDQGKSFTNYLNLYDDAVNIDLGKFKPAYLNICITRSPVKQGYGFVKMLNDYRHRYKNSTYFAHTDSVLRSNPEGKSISAKDTLITLEGRRLSWDNLIRSEKKFIIIDFWASWCGPCRQQLPLMDSIKKLVKNYPIDFFSMNIDESIDDWRTASRAEKTFLKENNYHLLNGRRSAIMRELKINSIPRYVVLNNSKIIASDFYQPIDHSFVKELLALINSSKSDK